MSLLLKSRDIFCVCGYEILENGKPSCCLYTRQAWEHPKNLMMLYWGKAKITVKIKDGGKFQQSLFCGGKSISHRIVKRSCLVLTKDV